MDKTRERIDYYKSQFNPGLIMWHKVDGVPEIFTLVSITHSGFAFTRELKTTGITITKTIPFDEFEKQDWYFNELKTLQTNPDYDVPIRTPLEMKKINTDSIRYAFEGVAEMKKVFADFDQLNEQCNQLINEAMH